MFRVKIVAALLIVGLFAAIHLAAPEFLPEVVDLLSRGDIVETAEYIKTYGSLAVVFSFLLTLFVNAIGFVPGIILSVLAETIGVSISFILLRFFFRDNARKIISKSKRLRSVDKYSTKNGFTVMLIARMVPYVPSGLLNAAGALSSMSLRDYFLASLVGKFPSTGIEAIIGHDAILHEEGFFRIIVVVIFAIALIAWAWWYQKKHNH